MGIQTIHHVMVAIPPAGEQDARRFYGETLGLIEIEKPGTLKSRGGLWFQAGTLELHLGIEEAFKPARKTHVAVLVSDLGALRERLIERGYYVTKDEFLPGYDRFYAADPFGNRLEFLESRFK